MTQRSLPLWLRAASIGVFVWASLGPAFAQTSTAPDLVAAATPPTWSAPEPVATASSIDEPLVATNAKGQILAVWNQGGQAWARVRQKGVWGNAVPVSPDGFPASVAGMAEAPNSDGVMAFLVEEAPPQKRLFTAFFSHGQWSPATLFSAPGMNIFAARVQFDSKSRATLAWTETDGVTCTVMAVSGTAANGWGIPQPVTTGCYTTLQLAVNKRGQAVVALGVLPTVPRASSPAVVVFRNAQGVWGMPMNFGRGERQTPPKVGLGDNGIAVATWSAFPSGVIWSRRAPNGTWSAPASVSDLVALPVPQELVVDATGDATVAYVDFFAPIVMTAELRTNSNQWTVPAAVTDPLSSIDAFHLATTPAGSRVVGWTDSTPPTPPGALGSVGVSTLGSKATTWSSVTLDSSDTSTFPPPAVAAASGRGVVLWVFVDSFGVDPALLRVSTASVR
jgi:hypothetical protein